MMRDFPSVLWIVMLGCAAACVAVGLYLMQSGNQIQQQRGMVFMAVAGALSFIVVTSSGWVLK